tara:strand:+ start:356 stop:808 length:453 start_codon:yes stop_codon:yes gene_type:complete
VWWFFRKLLQELRKGPRNQTYFEGLSSICYRVSEIITHAVEGLIKVDFTAVFVRFEKEVSQLEKAFNAIGDQGDSWGDLKNQVEEDLDGIRDRLFAYRELFTKRRAALERNDVNEVRKLSGHLNRELDLLRQTALMWFTRFDEASKRLKN